MDGRAGTGRIVQRGETLSISAELVRVQNNTQIWGEHYDRKLADVAAVQEEIAKDLSDKLQLKLSGEERKRLAKHPTENADAYQLYLKGLNSWNKRTREGIKNSIEYFNQAIEQDLRSRLLTWDSRLQRQQSEWGVHSERLLSQGKSIRDESSRVG